MREHDGEFADITAALYADRAFRWHVRWAHTVPASRRVAGWAASVVALVVLLAFGHLAWAQASHGLHVLAGG